MASSRSDLPLVPQVLRAVAQNLAKQGAAVTGVDLSEEMLAIARKANTKYTAW